MTPKITFRSYLPTDKKACLTLFDANCPEYFAPNERADYETFLEANPDNYELCFGEGPAVGAFGLIGSGSYDRTIRWILIDPSSHGLGIGASIMQRDLSSARESGVHIINIGASHKSAPFFARFGANGVAETHNGWGPGMHRVDMELRLNDN